MLKTKSPFKPCACFLQDPAEGAMDPTEGVFDDDDDFLLQATGDDGIPGGDNPDSDQDEDPFNLPIKPPGTLDDLQSNGKTTWCCQILNGSHNKSTIYRFMNFFFILIIYSHTGLCR